jgi:hypothetical protein
MSLEEDLKGKTLALISQQMANWVVEIQRNIQDHQATLMRSLDEMQESVARYDEKINESDIEMAMAEVVASQPPPPPPVAQGPGFDRLKASISAVEKGTSLSEVLTYLVNEVSQYVDRSAMFIVKGPSAIGWYARGVEPADVVKQVNIPLAGDTVFRSVNTSRQAVRGPLHQSPGTLAAVARLGGAPQSMLAVPLILRDKLAAILYCDTGREIDNATGDLIEVLVQFAGKIIDVLSLAPKPGAGRTTSTGSTPERAAAIRAGGEELRERAGVPATAAPPPVPGARPAAPPPPVPQDEGSSTVMFNASTFSAMKQAVAPPPPPRAVPPPPPPPPPAPAISPEEQKAHDDAKRFARLVVSEIKLYNEAKVTEGRRNKDIYERLKEDIERGRHMYTERVNPAVRDTTNYFYDELVRILAGGDQSALGPM